MTRSKSRNRLKFSSSFSGEFLFQGRTRDWLSFDSSLKIACMALWKEQYGNVEKPIRNPLFIQGFPYAKHYLAQEMRRIFEFFRDEAYAKEHLTGSCHCH